LAVATSLLAVATSLLAVATSLLAVDVTQESAAPRLLSSASRGSYDEAVSQNRVRDRDARGARDRGTHHRGGRCIGASITESPDPLHNSPSGTHTSQVGRGIPIRILGLSANATDPQRRMQ
jgi:opacity protein-like surface antigen